MTYNRIKLDGGMYLFQILSHVLKAKWNNNKNARRQKNHTHSLTHKYKKKTIKNGNLGNNSNKQKPDKKRK